VYYGIWLIFPDYFVVSSETNIYPIQLLRILLWGNPADKTGLDNPQPSLRGLDEMAKDAVPIAEERRILTDKRHQLDDEDRKLKQELTKVQATMEQNRAKRIAVYEEMQMAPLLNEQKELENKIEGLKEFRPSSSSEEDSPLDLPIAEMNVDLARKNYEIATKRLAIADKVVSDFGSFAEPGDLATYTKLQNQATEVRNRLEDIGNRESNLRERIYSLHQRWNKERTPRLGLGDFFYFSIGVSTTVTFGDITPNHYGVRALVTIQILVSVLLVGMFLNSLAPSGDGIPSSDSSKPIVRRYGKGVRRVKISGPF
jgi:ion channel